MENIKNKYETQTGLKSQVGTVLEEKASFITQGNQCDWQEAWGGFRGTGNC